MELQNLRRQAGRQIRMRKAAGVTPASSKGLDGGIDAVAHSRILLGDCEADGL